MAKIITIIDCLSIGGAEIQTVDLLNELCQTNEILLLSIGSANMITNRIHAKISVELLGKKSYMDFKVLRKIALRLEKYKPDFVLLVDRYAMMYGYLASVFHPREYNLAVIVHTTILRTPIEKLQNIFYKRIMAQVDKIIFVCNNQKTYWQKKYRINPDKSVVIYNGIDCSKYSNRINKPILKKELGFNDSDIIIGINAILRPEKKHEYLVDAIEMFVRDGYRNIKLLIIGDGVQRKFLDKYIAHKQLGNYVLITGYKDDVRPYLACVDISVLTSTSVETFSMGILESMAMGKTVVLSNIGGASEMVEHGVNGYIYNAGNINELYSCLRDIIDRDLYKQMGEESIKRVNQFFNRDLMIQRYFRLFGQIPK